MDYIPYGRQTISEDDIAAVVDVLRSDFLTQGPAVPAFEQAVTALCGARHGIAVNSATSALHLACLALGVGPGDMVWTSPITFVASANCARYCGADVDFVDIDPATCNMSVAALETRLEKSRREGRLPKVVIPVHFAGQSCDMAAIHALSLRYDFRVIEDASHAIGGQYQGRAIGDCRYSDITIFSFHPVKIITTGEGGMAVTNDDALAARMTLLRSHGVTRQTDAMTHAPEGPWYYQQRELGFNYRMTDMQAALGVSQLRKIGVWIARRHAIASRYDAELAALPLQLPANAAYARSALHLYVIRVETGAPLDRSALFGKLREDGIGVNVHYIPVHLQPYYRDMGFKVGDFPASEDYYKAALSLPIHPALTDDQQGYVIERLKLHCETAGA